MTYRSIYVFFTGMVTDIVIYHTVPYLSIYCLYPTPNDLVYIYIYTRVARGVSGYGSGLLLTRRCHSSKVVKKDVQVAKSKREPTKLR